MSEEAEKLATTLKALELQERLHRDVKKFQWAKVVAVGAITGGATCAMVGWTTRAYVESLKTDLRAEIRQVMEPQAERQRESDKEMWEIHKEIWEIKRDIISLQRRQDGLPGASMHIP